MTFKEVADKIKKQTPKQAYSTEYIQVEFIYSRKGIHRRRRAMWIYLN